MEVYAGPLSLLWEFLKTNQWSVVLTIMPWLWISKSVFKCFDFGLFFLRRRHCLGCTQTRQKTDGAPLWCLSSLKTCEYKNQRQSICVPHAQIRSRKHGAEAGTVASSLIRLRITIIAKNISKEWGHLKPHVHFTATLLVPVGYITILLYSIFQKALIEVRIYQ